MFYVDIALTLVVAISILYMELSAWFNTARFLATRETLRKPSLGKVVAIYATSLVIIVLPIYTAAIWLESRALLILSFVLVLTTVRILRLKLRGYTLDQFRAAVAKK